jgi:hypothetical protein
MVELLGSYFMRRHFIAVLTCLTALTSCGSSKTESSTVLNSAPSNISAPTTLPAWKVQQLAGEKAERDWSQLYATNFYRAVVLGQPKSQSRYDMVTAIARDLAEAKGAVTQLRTSEYEVIRLVVANFVNEVAIALEELLDAISASDQVGAQKAYAQYTYLEEQRDRIVQCVHEQKLNC